MDPNLSKVLADLAAKLGTSVEQLWPVLVAHTRLSAIITVISLLVSSIALGAAAAWMFKPDDNRSSFDDGSCKMVGSLLAFIAFLILMACLCCIPDIVYPEIYALKSILNK